jgi:lipid-A-disaccharide synthase-like uncharacterized protein
MGRGSHRRSDADVLWWVFSILGGLLAVLLIVLTVLIALAGDWLTFAVAAVVLAVWGFEGYRRRRG